jgi:hypothetical protein
MNMQKNRSGTVSERHPERSKGPRNCGDSQNAMCFIETIPQIASALIRVDLRFSVTLCLCGCPSSLVESAMQKPFFIP